MARKNQVEDVMDDENASAASLDALMDMDYENLPEVMDTIPTGTWKLRARNAAYKEASGDQNAKVLIFLIPAEPLSDVDPEALEAAGADYDFTNNQIVYTQYVENLRDLKKVLTIVKTFGVDLDGLSPREAIKKVRGKEVIASIGTRSYKSKRFGDVTENTVSGFASVEDYIEDATDEE